MLPKTASMELTRSVTERIGLEKSKELSPAPAPAAASAAATRERRRSRSAIGSGSKSFRDGANDSIDEDDEVFYRNRVYNICINIRIQIRC